MSAFFQDMPFKLVFLIAYAFRIRRWRKVYSLISETAVDQKYTSIRFGSWRILIMVLATAFFNMEGDWLTGSGYLEDFALFVYYNSHPTRKGFLASGTLDGFVTAEGQ